MLSSFSPLSPMSPVLTFRPIEKISASAQLARVLRSHGPRFVAYARRANPEIGRLEAQLSATEARLGTADECESDFDQCREIAHRLSSLFCIGAMVDFVPAHRGLEVARPAEQLAS